MLVEQEVIAGGHCHPVVGESLQPALTPGGHLGRVAGDLGWSLTNLPPDVVELLFNVHLALFSSVTTANFDHEYDDHDHVYVLAWAKKNWLWFSALAGQFQGG